VGRRDGRDDGQAEPRPGVRAGPVGAEPAEGLAQPGDLPLATPTSRLGRISVPILGCQSWQDGVASSRPMELYENTFSPRTSWFIGMNGGHGICEFRQTLTMLVKFFKHYVAGVNNGWQNKPHVTILHEVSGGTTSPPSPAWTSTYNSWFGLIKPVTLYFQPDSSLATSPPAGVAGRSFFSGPSPSQSGRWTKRPAPGSSVSYTTPPLARTVDFFGPGSIDLWLSSTARDTDIEVIISEVRPDGMDQYVQAGWLDVAQRKLAPAGNGPGQSSVLRPYQTHTQADRQPLSPGKPVYARVELFPSEHVFRKGSSIRITIASAMGPVESTGLWGLTSPQTPFTDTIYAGPSRPSQVILGLIPGATAKAPLPRAGPSPGSRAGGTPYRCLPGGSPCLAPRPDPSAPRTRGVPGPGYGWYHPAEDGWWPAAAGLLPSVASKPWKRR
jgi:uncharacterized protein